MQPPFHEPMTTRLSSKGQVVIPRLVREALGIHNGTEFSIRVEKNEVRLVPQRDFSKLFAYAEKMRKTYHGKALSASERKAFLQDYAARQDVVSRKPTKKPKS